jgi:hypothetical protein
MEGVVLVVPGALFALVYLLQPLVSETTDRPWDQFELLGGDGTTAEDRTGTTQVAAAPTEPEEARAMTDGGRVCHSCGAVVDGDYLYCGECLTPRV